MAISYIGRAAGTTTATMPAHAIGDLLLVFAFRDGSATPPSLGSGFTSITTQAGTTCSMRVGYKIATATNDATGTWTSATTTIAHVYRGTDGASSIGNFTPSAGTTATTTFAATAAAGSNSWFAGFAGSRVASTTIAAPSGMTSRGATSDTTDSAVGCDTNATSAGWAAANVTVSATGWCSVVVEIKERSTSRTMTFSMAETEVISVAIDKSNPNKKTFIFTQAEVIAQNSALNRLRDQPGKQFNSTTKVPSGADTTNNAGQMAWNGTTWCWVFPNSTTCYTSTDLTSWTAQTASLPVAGELPYICSDGTQFCYVPGLAAGSTVAATSPDGATWTTRTLPASGQWTWVSYDTDRFVTVRQGATTNGGAYSTTGATWTGVTFSIGMTGRLSTVRLTTTYHVFGSDQTNLMQYNGFGAGGGNGFSSGTSFMAVASGANNGTIKIVAGAGPSDKAINYVYSTTTPAATFANWTSRTLPYTRIWGQPIWDGTYFIVPSTTDGAVCYSTDGINWSGVITSSTGSYYTARKGSTGFTPIFNNSVSPNILLFNSGYSQPSIRVNQVESISSYLSTPQRMQFAIDQIETITPILSADYDLVVDTGWHYPSANNLFDNNGSSTWTNPTNGYADDGVFATNSTAGGSSDYLNYSGFGFAIPAGAIISGIQMALTAKGAVGGDMQAIQPILVVGATTDSPPSCYITKDQLYGYWCILTTTNIERIFGSTYGGPNSGWNGWYEEYAADGPTPHTLTVSELNDAAFGVTLEAINMDSSTRITSVDSVKIKVHYIIRSKNFRTEIAEAVAYAMDLTTEVGYNLMSFTVAEAEELTIAAARARNLTLTQAEVESIALDALKRSRSQSFSSNNTETITMSAIRNRKMAGMVVSYEEQWGISRIHRTRPESFTNAEIEAINGSIKRIARSLPFAITETYVISNALSRLKQESFSNSLVESISNIALKRNRTETFSIAEAEAILSIPVIRSRKVLFDIVESIVYTISLGGPQKPMSFSVNEIETMVLSAVLQRKLTLTDSMIEALIVTTIARVKKAGLTITESEAINLLRIGRVRPEVFTIAETETISSSLSKLKQVTLALAEAIGYTFTVVKLKALTTTIAEIDGFTFGAIRRTRKVIEAINEVIAYATSMKVARPLSGTIAEAELIQAAIKRVRTVQESIAESETITMPLSRKKQIGIVVSESETVIASLARMKLMNYIVSQTESVSNIFLRRVRNAPFAVTEHEVMTANFNRARALLLPISETEQMTLNVGRLREQIITIAETQGIEVALARLKQLVQTISNTLDYTIDLTVYPDTLNPASFDITLEWAEWTNISCSLLNSVYELTDKTVTFTIVNKSTSSQPIQIGESSSTVEFTTETDSIQPTESMVGNTTVVIPNGIF